MPNSGKNGLSRIRVVNGVGGPMLYVGNTRIETLADGKNLTDRHIKIVECLLSQSGRVVTYEELARTMKWGGTRDDGFKHCLRQYIHQMKSVFRKAEIHAHFTVAEGVGYSLCEPARA
jgi:DNA-binding response OmpR family regulator